MRKATAAQSAADQRDLSILKALDAGKTQAEAAQLHRVSTSLVSKLVSDIRADTQSTTHETRAGRVIPVAAKLPRLASAGRGFLRGQG